MKLCRWTVAAVTAMLVAPTAWPQSCGFEWVNPLPPRADLHRVFERSGLLVAVGARGTIVTSTDGLAWRLRSSPTTADLYGVDWGEGLFMAVGDGVIVSSPDGATWTTRWSGGGVRLHDVEYGDGRFVAVGSGLDGGVLVSESGTTWTQHDTGLEHIGGAIVWTGSSFLAAGADEVYASEDGLTWEVVGNIPSRLARKATALDPAERIDLAYDDAGPRFVWVGGLEVFTSADGSEWDLARELDGCAGSSALLSVMADGGSIAVGGYSACPDPYFNPNSRILLSVDGGVSWNTVYNERGGGVAGMARRGSRTVAVGLTGEVLSSTNLSSWSCVPGACNADACADGFFDAVGTAAGTLAVGGVGSCAPAVKRIEGGTVARSSGGVQWTVTEIPTGRLRGVTHDGAGYVAVGNDLVATSTDGAQWSQSSLDRSIQLEAVEWASGVLVAVGAGGAVLASSNAQRWDRQYSFTESDLADVCWTGQRFVAVGEGGTVLQSLDGYNWDQPRCICSAALRAVAAHGGHVFVTGEGGRLWSSSDLVEWAMSVVPGGVELAGMASDGEHLIAVGSGPAVGGVKPAAVMVSEDGVHWTRLRAPGGALRRVVWTGSEYVAVGDDRGLVRAGCLGTLIGLDPPQAELSWGRSLEMTVTLDAIATTTVDVNVTTNQPAAVELPSMVQVPAGSDHTVLEVTGTSVAESVIVTVRLPESLGGAWAEAELTVIPLLPDPRRGGRRVHP